MVNELSSLAAYHEELQKPGIVVIDFYSPTCGPCKVSRAATHNGNYLTIV